MVIDIESYVDTLENQRVAVQNSDDFAGNLLHIHILKNIYLDQIDIFRNNRTTK